MMEIPTSLIEYTIHRGTIIHSYGFTDIGHGKFFVVIGVSGDYMVGFFPLRHKYHDHCEEHSRSRHCRG